MTSTTTPAPRAAAPPAVQQQSSGGGMLSGIGSTIAQGMAFGTGSAIAHRAVGAAAEALTGGGGQQHQQQSTVDQMPQQSMASNGPCASDKQLFFECLKENRGDQQACSFLYEALQSCQRNGNQMSFQ
jgi:hypothetical protein